MYNVYVYGMNAEYIERVRCGSRYIVYNFDANGACMVEKKVRFGISRGVGCENDNHENCYCQY